MDRKSWLWRKKSSEKIISAAEQSDASPTARACEEQVVKRNVPPNSDESRNPSVLSDIVKDLSERLASVLAESKAKDDRMEEHKSEIEEYKNALEEALSGWEGTKAKAVSLKEKLDAALQQKAAAELHGSHLDGALKECMRELRHVREEHEQVIHDVAMDKTRELDFIRAELEGKLAERNQRMLEAAAENSVLHKSLQETIRSLEEMRERKAQAEDEINRLHIKLTSVEQANVNVKYELRVLEKQLEIRDEEREYNKKATDASNRQHAESMRKIAKLEAECQRLRVLVRKKLPGPAAVAQMKIEVETLSKDEPEWKRKMSYIKRGEFPGGSTIADPAQDSAQENSSKRIKYLQERLFSLEEEAEILKETLVKRNNELQVSRVMCARTTNKLSKVESKLDALCRQHGINRTDGMAIDGQVELSKYVSMTSEPSLASISEYGGNEDEASCAESWASALISELASFKKVKSSMLTNKLLESPDFDLMDDFVEMERLATVSSEKMVESPTFSGKTELESGGHTEFKAHQNSNTLPMKENEVPSEATHTKMTEEVLVSDKSTTQDQSFSTFQSRMQANELALSSTHELLHMVFDAHAKGQNMDEVLENVKAAISPSQHSGTEQISKIKEKLTCLKVLNSDGLKNSYINNAMSGQLSPRSPSEGNSSEDEMVSFSCSKHNKNALNDSKLNASIHKILELIEGFAQANSANHSHSECTPLSSSGSQLIQNSISVPGYTVRVLQWQNAELDSLIQSLVKICSDLLQGKAEIVEFIENVSSALDWIVNHFFSLQDVSSMRDIIKKQLQWNDELHSDSESEGQDADNPTSGEGTAKTIGQGEYENEYQTFSSATGASESNYVTNAMNKLEEGQKLLSEKEMLENQLNEQVNTLQDKLTILQSEKQELEGTLQQANKNLEAAVMCQHLEIKKKFEELERELAACKESRQLLENENEELDFQLKSARAELYQFQKKMASLQAELEEKGSCFQELQATYLDLQLQLESGSKLDTSKDEKAAILRTSNREDKMQLKKERDISAATKMVAELRQQINDMEKRVKDLSSPEKAKDVSLQSSSVSPLPQKTTLTVNEHASLSDHMQSENVTKESQNCPAESPKMKDLPLPRGKKDENSQQESSAPRNDKTGLFYGWQTSSESSSIGSHKHEKQIGGGHSHDDTPASPVSPAKFLSMNMNSGSPKSFSGEGIRPVSPKKRSHGAVFTRLLWPKKKGH